MIIYVLIGLGSVISIALAVVVYRQIRALRQKKSDQLTNQLKLANIQRERYEYIESSLNILTDALVNGQVGVIEGAIRVKALLDYYDPSLVKDPAHEVFVTIHTQTEHIPIKEAWKQLDKPIRRKHELLMARLEIAHGEKVIEAARRLNAYINKVNH